MNRATLRRVDGRFDLRVAILGISLLFVAILTWLPLNTEPSPRPESLLPGRSPASQIPKLPEGRTGDGMEDRVSGPQKRVAGLSDKAPGSAEARPAQGAASSGPAFEGRVYDALGTPVRDARIRAIDESDPSIERALEARSGDGGRFLLSLKKPGLYTLSVEHKEFARRAPIRHLLAREGRSTPLGRIELSMGRRISGRVFARDAGALSAVRVFLRPQLVEASGPFGAPVEERRTDARGYFRFDGLEDRLYRLELRPDPPFVARVLDGLTAGRTDTRALEIELESGKTLYGVLRLRGQALSGARLRLSPAEAQETPTLETQSQNDGSFRFPPSLPGQHLLELERGPGRPVFHQKIALPRAGPFRIDLTPGRELLLHFRAKSPLPDQLVVTRVGPTGERSAGRTHSLRAAQLVLSDLPPSGCELLIDAKGFAQARIPRFELSEARSERSVELIAGASLKVELRSSSVRAPAPSKIWLIDPSKIPRGALGNFPEIVQAAVIAKLRPDSEGRILRGGLSPGHYRLETRIANGPRVPIAAIELRSGATKTLELSWPPPTGSIRVERQGPPVSGEDLLLEHPKLRWALRLKIPRDGILSIPGLPEGRYSVETLSNADPESRNQQKTVQVRSGQNVLVRFPGP